MIDKRHQALLKEIVNSKIKLPAIKRIRISKVTDSDSNLSKFLQNCFPSSLGLFWMNYNWVFSRPVKVRFYMRSLSKAVSKVTKEIFFSQIELRDADLQNLIKSAWNVERVVLQACSIYCSSHIDFGRNSKYNTKFLSFQYWGDSDEKALTTIWKSDPSSFIYIVDAIDKSGLRDSLVNICIKYNGALTRIILQEQLKARNLTHISVINKCSSPSTS